MVVFASINANLRMEGLDQKRTETTEPQVQPHTHTQTPEFLINVNRKLTDIRTSPWWKGNPSRDDFINDKARWITQAVSSHSNGWWGRQRLHKGARKTKGAKIKNASQTRNIIRWVSTLHNSSEQNNVMIQQI